MAMEKLSLGVMIGASLSPQFTSAITGAGKKLMQLGRVSEDLGKRRLKLVDFDKSVQAVQKARTAFADAAQKVRDLEKALKATDRASSPEKYSRLKQEMKSAVSAMRKAEDQLKSNSAAYVKQKSVVAQAGITLGNYKQQLKSVTEELDRNTVKQERAAKMSQLRGNLGVATARFAGVAATVSLLGGKVFNDMVRPAAEFNSELLQIGITGDLTDQQLRQLKTTLTNLSSQTGQSTENLQKGLGFLVAAGMDTSTAERSVGTIGQVATAYKADVEDISRASYTLNDSLKIDPSRLKGALGILASAGKSGNVELRDMAKVMPTLGASFAALKMQGPEAVATMGAALQIARKGAASGEEAANNMSNFLSKIMSPTTLKKAQKSFGVDLAAIVKNAQQTGANPIEAVLEKIREITKGGDQKLLGDLFQDMQVQNFLRPMMQQYEEYKKIKQDALGAADGAIIDQDLARTRNDGLQQLNEFSNAFSNLKRTIGDSLTGGNSGGVLQFFTGILNKATEFAQKNPGVVRSVLLVAGALGVLAVAAATIGAVFAGLKLAAVGLGLALTGPIVLGIVAVVAIGALVAANWDRISAVMTGAWQGITAAASGMWDRVVGFFSGGIGNISAKIVNWSPMGLFYRVFAAVLSWFGVELPAKFTEFGSMLIQGLINGIKAKWESVKKTMGLLASSVQSAFTNPNMIQSPSRLFMQYGGFIVEGLRLGIGRNAAKAVAAAGAMALGVSSAGAGMRADMPMRITAASRPAQTAASAAPVQAGGAQYTINVYQQAGENGEDFARRVVSIIEQHQGRQRRASLGDWHGGI